MIDQDRIAELKDEIGEEDFRDVINMFFEEVGETIDNLDTTDTGRLSGDLHLLKGSALNIGLSDLSSLCREAEIALKADPANIPDISAIKSAFDAARSAFDTNMTFAA